MNTDIHDEDLEEAIQKYFNDDEQVWVVVDDNGFNANHKLPDELFKKISNTKSIKQRVFLLTFQKGFYLKQLDDDQIVLVIKEFSKRPVGVKKETYIFKIKN